MQSIWSNLGQFGGVESELSDLRIWYLITIKCHGITYITYKYPEQKTLGQRMHLLISFLVLIVKNKVLGMFVTNSTIAFKLKYPNLADLLEYVAPDIDASKYLAYGCNCHFLDNRPLATAGHGASLDPIDQACKNYKDCQRCVQMDDGNDCTAENEDWTYSFETQSEEVECLNPVKSCRRHLCECDKQVGSNLLQVYYNH